MTREYRMRLAAGGGPPPARPLRLQEGTHRRLRPLGRGPSPLRCRATHPHRCLGAPFCKWLRSVRMCAVEVARMPGPYSLLKVTKNQRELTAQRAARMTPNSCDAVSKVMQH